MSQGSSGLFDGYPSLPGTYDEMFDDGAARAAFQRIAQQLATMSADELARAQQIAETALLQQGVTFSVYGDARGTEKIFPFCLLPRMIAAIVPAMSSPAGDDSLNTIRNTTSSP